ncbi:MAG: hypothetical protein KAU20_05335 [Nanoarchaeota archaeon]|nr:hypothetical protein [Nanoarchaeota archaeon]
MANEAVCIETPTIFERKTIAAGAVIPIGSIMQLSSDPNTISISDGDNVFGGIAWEESTATDEFTELVVAMNGTWDIKDSGAGMTLGNMCSVNGVNLVKTLIEADVVLGKAVGKVQETATAAEVVRVKVGSHF